MTDFTRAELEALIARDHYDINGLRSVYSDTMQRLARALLASMEENAAEVERSNAMASEITALRVDLEAAAEAKLAKIAAIVKDWRTEDSAEHYNMLRDLATILGIEQREG